MPQALGSLTSLAGDTCLVGSVHSADPGPSSIHLCLPGGLGPVQVVQDPWQFSLCPAEGSIICASNHLAAAHGNGCFSMNLLCGFARLEVKGEEGKLFFSMGDKGGMSRDRSL